MKRNLLIASPAYSLSGYGAHSRDIIESLWNSDKFNISCIINGWAASSSLEDMSINMKDILEFCLKNKLKEEQDFVFMHIGIPTEFKKVSKTFNIGVTAGLEADSIPKEWVKSCNEMDLVIVPSAFEKNIFISSGVKTRLEVVREGVDTAVFKPSQPAFKLPDEIETKFNFITTGQWINYGVGRDRKQIGLLIKLFLETFRDNPDVGLLLRTYTNNHSTSDRFFTTERIKELKEESGSKASIYLIHGEITDENTAAIYNNPGVKAFISLTSGEGWGRGLAEAASCDVPIIVTGWSGHMDFLNKEYSTFIPFKLLPVPSGIAFFTKGMRWAYVEIEKAVEEMQKIVSDYAPYKAKAEAYGPIFRDKFNKEKTYKKLIDVLEECL